MNYPAASSGVSDSLDSGFRRNDELAASGGEYNPKRFKGVTLIELMPPNRSHSPAVLTSKNDC